MIDSIRADLANTELELYWDDLTQHPTELGKPVSWLQLSGATVFPNKPNELELSGRITIWDTDLDKCEQFILRAIAYLGEYTASECIGDVALVRFSEFNVAYSGQVEDSDLDGLESYTLSLTFNLTATLKG